MNERQIVEMIKSALSKSGYAFHKAPGKIWYFNDRSKTTGIRRLKFPIGSHRGVSHDVMINNVEQKIQACGVLKHVAHLHVRYRENEGYRSYPYIDVKVQVYDNQLEHGFEMH